MKNFGFEAETSEYFVKLTKNLNLAELCALIPQAYEAAENDVQRVQLQGIFLSRAKEIGSSAEMTVRSVFRKLNLRKDVSLQPDRNNGKQENAVRNMLESDFNGVRNSLNNYSLIMANDPHYAGVRYNLLSIMPEMHYTEDGIEKVRPWTDADEVESFRHIENTYGIYSNDKHSKALIELFDQRKYHPIREIVESIVWDGRSRITEFLTQWAKCEDTAYTREVSRLIFAGGIHRLMEPGCKFDSVPILVGGQGAGKSTLIRWLALEDRFFNELTQLRGKQSIECLEGTWICEIAELLALKHDSDVEAGKAFLSRQSDKYRRAYGRNTDFYPRRCIFIGSTNVEQFLYDKSGNRRYLPLHVHSNGYELYDHEQECREYIRQCWAEALFLYRKGEISPAPDRLLRREFEAAQNAALVEDWRPGAVEAYLERFRTGDRVCAIQIYQNALMLPGDRVNPTPTVRESYEIGQMVAKVPGWVRLQNSVRFETYGKQKGWQKVS